MTEKNRAESKLGVQDRVVQTSEYAAMRRAVEAYHGTLSDKELPSKSLSLLAQKLEQVEENAPVVEDLRDATSLEDAETEAYAAVIDPASSCLQIKPGRAMTVPPATPEELRLRRRRLGLAWHMIRSKRATRSWLPESIVDAFRRLSDFVLGDKVAGLRAEDGRVPKWSLILKYESELRKRAYQSVRDGAVGDLGAALKAACAAPDLFAFHFMTPFSLGGCTDSLGGTGQVEVGAGWKGAGKGLGKNGDCKGKVLKTIAKHKRGPDGKLLCFRFQKKAGCPVAPTKIASSRISASGVCSPTPTAYGRGGLGGFGGLGTFIGHVKCSVPLNCQPTGPKPPSSFPQQCTLNPEVKVPGPQTGSLCLHH